MPSLVAHARRVLRGALRELWPTPEYAIRRQLERAFVRAPRYTPGHVAAGAYRIEFADAGSVWPQWDDIFIHGTMAFESASSSPRILDCGANVGIASLYFKRRYPRATITAFEADPHLADICRRNLAANGAADVDVRAAAVWTRAGEVEFICEGSDSGAIASVDPSVAGNKSVVPAVRLRDWLAEPVDLLKLDIEGAELPVLEDCRDQLSNVRAIVMDLHEFDPSRRQTGAVFDLLDAAGFVYDLKHLVSLPSRVPPPRSPFPDAAPAWAASVRAWRR